MRFNVFLPSVFLFAMLCSGVTHGAQNERAETAFRGGVEAFQKKDFAKARASFNEGIQAAGETPLLLFNLGVVENQQGNKGYALALWRKALVQSPNFAPAKRAVEWTRTKLERPEIPHEVEIWENFRQTALVPVSLDLLVLATALLLLGGGWLLFRQLGKRRAARLDERPMPSFSYSTVICLVGFLAFGFLASAKAFDSQEVRGTILPKKVEAHSSPSQEATVLFELFEGLEVITRERKDGWVQVTYPGGSTGWIPEHSVFATNAAIPAQAPAPAASGKAQEK